MTIHHKVHTLDYGWAKLCQVTRRALFGTESKLDEPESTLKNKVTCEKCKLTFEITRMDKEQSSQAAETKDG